MLDEISKLFDIYFVTLILNKKKYYRETRDMLI